MNIKLLSYLLIALNVFIVASALPTIIILTISTVVVLSLIVSHTLLRLILKILILITSLAILKINFTPLLVPEAGVSFILILSALKLWELESNTDYFNMFLILGLTIGSIFILNSSLSIFIIGLLQIAAFFYFILKLRNYNLNLLNFKRIFYLTIPAIIFSLFLFYTFPRFTQGFNSTRNFNSYLSEANSKLSFDKLGPINPSTKIIFHVKGVSPSPQQYWRSLILRGNHNNDWITGTPKKIANGTGLLDGKKYTVFLSDDFNDYLPTLDGLSKIETSSDEYFSYDDGTFRLKNILKRGVVYSVVTQVHSLNLGQVKTPDFKTTILKSKDKNFIANEIIGESTAKNLSDLERLNLVIKYFQNKHYGYSLSPPYYPSIEEFIKQGHLGYCSHFASAFVYMARAINLPARIVLGFQGGEYNPYDQSLVIRELDGHAWAEVYIANEGWKRIDPTAMVAPDLLRMGTTAFLKKINPSISFYFFNIPKSTFEFKILNSIAQRFDALNLHFNDALSNFNKDSQLQILKNTLPSLSSWGMQLAIILFFFFGIYFTIKFYITNKKLSANEKRYNKFIKFMRRHGLNKLDYETISIFRDRCLETPGLAPGILEYLNRETEFYISAFYQN
jgi:hypothetical protein